MKIPGAIFFLLLLCQTGMAQQKDTKEKIPYLERDSLYRIHSPRKALLLSAALPGAGQIYNKKTWKAPVVWAGMGTCIFFIRYNDKIYKEYKEDYIAFYDNNPATVFDSALPINTVESEMNRFRKYKEISYLALAGVYVLNLLDAYVDGYLYHYEVNEDLTIGINPVVRPASPGVSHEGYVGFTFALDFK